MLGSRSIEHVGPPQSGIDAEREFAAWRLAADTLPTVLFTARPDGAIEWLNSRWSQFFGLDPSAGLENAWQSIVHPGDLAEVARSWESSIRTGQDVEVEFRLRKMSGEYVWLLGRASARLDETGNIVRWYGIVVDIDDRKQTESLLADSERKFRVLAEAIPVICWTADASGWIDWYNRRWYQVTGQTEEEARGWGWQAAHHPDDFLDVMKRWSHSIATGEQFEMEFRLRQADGLFHWFFTCAEPLRDEAGNILRWYGSNVDVNAQKEALERTKRVAETLQNVFLPKELPRPSGIRLDAVYLPAERDALVGGDWFDAFELADGRLAFSIGDVAGHGLEASIIVGRLRQAIFTLAFRVHDSAEILKGVDEILCHQDPDIVVTALVGFIDATRTVITYSTAGHPSPMIAYPGDKMARILPGGDPPLGAPFHGERQTFTAPIAKDSVIAFYTDGMTEYARDMLTAEVKLQAAVALMVGNKTIARPAIAVKDIVLDDAPTQDDAALMLLQFSDVQASLLRFDPSVLEKTWLFHSSDAHSARSSRHQIMTYLRSLAAIDQDFNDTELIIGEILANTVEHAPGLVHAEIDWLKEHPVITVRDTGPGLRTMRSALPVDDLDEDGRGLYLIKTLAINATVKASPGYGTEMTVVLPLRR